MSVHDHYLSELAKAQHREAVRQSDPGAIRADLARAGIVMPIVEGAYRIGTRRVLDQAEVASWYAVQTAPRMETTAADALRDVGHLCRVPMRAYLRQTRQKDKQGKFIKVRAEVPLCTGYAFLGVGSGTPDWRTIRGRDGVQGVVGVGGTPEPIRAVAKLYAIFAADEAGAFDEAKPQPEWEAEPGMAVQVMDGPFAGFVAQIKRAKGDAVRIVIDALFGGAEIDIDRSKLERIA